MPERPESSSDEPLRRNRDFSTLLVSQSVSVVGDGVSETALPLLVSVRAANSPDQLVGRIASTARVMALGLMPIGSLIGGILIDTVGGTGTLAILGASICVLALGFSQVRPLRAASLAPPHMRAAEPLFPISDGLEG